MHRVGQEEGAAWAEAQRGAWLSLPQEEMGQGAGVPASVPPGAAGGARSPQPWLETQAVEASAWGVGRPSQAELGNADFSVLSLHSLTPQNLHKRGDGETVAMLTGEGGRAGPLSQPGAPSLAPLSTLSPLSPQCQPAQTPETGREPTGEKGLEGWTALEKTGVTGGRSQGSAEGCGGRPPALQGTQDTRPMPFQ